MNRNTILFLFLFVGSQLAAQNTETRNLKAFKTVSVSQGINTYLSEGSTESARIVVSGNLDLEDVLTDVDGSGELDISLDGNNFRNVDVKVYVTYRKLEGLKASSAGSIQVRDDVSCDCTFEIDVSSAGEVEIDLKANSVELEASSAGNIEANIEAMEIEASASSAGEIEIEGKVREIEVQVSSSGDFSGYDLISESANLRASSGGSINLTVTKEIVARASSGGSISYEGNPQYTDKESSSGGSVRKH
ncbi:MAG: hypothetical protein ACJA08_000499 [Cyclobacteriaceae bacterium]|jgi:hypothetical protein